MLCFLALFALIATTSAREWTRFHGPKLIGNCFLDAVWFTPQSAIALFLDWMCLISL